MEKQITISEKLQRARTYEKQQINSREMAEKPAFHVCAPVGWINDPNGFSEYQGEKHLFFQYHPYDTVWGPMHWGHMKTTDFIKWENLPPALAPDEAYDGFGCFSGSAIEWKGRHVLAYTGVERVEKDGKITDYQRQCVAIGNGTDYEKIEQNPVITGEMIPDGGSVLDFRDPKIWADGDEIYMVVGNRAADGSGQILLYRTNDLRSWEFVTILDKCDNRYGKMWECPDFFALDGMNVLVVSPQEMKAVEQDFHAGDGSIAILGLYNKEKHEFTEKSVQAIDMGLDFYAPQTMQSADGRRIMIGWLQSWSANWFDAKDGFCGMMTIPRELEIRNGKLLQSPVRELENYYANTQILEAELLKREFEHYEMLDGRIMNLELVLEGEDAYVFEMKLAADADSYTLLRYDRRNELLIFDRSHSGVRRDVANVRSMRVLSNGSIVRLRILMDRYSIELFVNDGEQAMTSVIRTPIESDEVYIRADGRVSVYAKKNEIHMK